MAREQAEATSKEKVLTALGEAPRRGCAKSSASRCRRSQRFDVPLPRATTPSLDALHAYSLALSEGREVPRLESIPHLKRAIELDPTFAMAHAQLSSVYANTGQSALAPAVLAKGVRAARSGERTRDASSSRGATTATRRRTTIRRWSWRASGPRRIRARHSRSTRWAAALIRYGDFAQAAEALRQAIRLDPKFAPAYSNLAAVLMALGQLRPRREQC